MTSLRDQVKQLFTSAAARPAGAIGAELELIPVYARDKSRVGIGGTASRRGTADVIRVVAGSHDWDERVDAYGAPAWATSDGGRISYEPGGQIELSSPVFSSHTELTKLLTRTVAALREAASDADIELLAVGADPYNDIDAAPLALHAPRYELMAAYFDRISPDGARMMRQTAALQINIELGEQPFMRWRLLNALAPYLTARFANSPRYAGRETGYASYRAQLWRSLDCTRTGLPYSDNDPIGEYARFAADAGRILDDDSAHLTTLFPEVRPRGYFELRCIDALGPPALSEALELVSTLTTDDDRASAAAELLGAPDAALLDRAAVHGAADPLIRHRLDALDAILRT